MTVPDGPTAPAGAGSRARFLLALAVVAGAFGSLDSMLNIAFPDLTARLGIAVTDLQWIVTAYVLASGGCLIAAGRLGDALGHRRMLAAGGLLSALGLGACAAAPGFSALVVGRAFQGAGTALVLASTPALVAEIAGAEGTGRAMGLFQMSAAAGLALGPLTGGPLVGALDWRAVFWVRVPVALLLALWAARTPAPASAPPRAPAAAGGSGPAPRSGGAAAARGPALLAATLTALLLAANLSLRPGAPSPLGPVLAGVGVVLAVLLTLDQRRSPDPVVAPDVLARPAFLTANLLAVTANGAAFVGWLFLSSYVVNQRGHAASAGGLVLAAGPAATALAAPVAGRLSDRFGPGLVSTVGLATLTAGLVAGGAAAFAGSIPGLTAAWVGAGLGLGLFTVPNMAFVFGSLPAHRQGVAGGLVLTMRTVGIVVGVALLSRYFGANQSRGFATALGRTFVVAAAVTGAGLAVSIVRLALDRHRPGTLVTLASDRLGEPVE